MKRIHKQTAAPGALARRFPVLACPAAAGIWCLLAAAALARGQDVEKVLEIIRSMPAEMPPAALALGGAANGETGDSGGEEAPEPALPVPLLQLRGGLQVRGNFLEQTLPIETPYGVLQIPFKDMVEVRFHLQPDAAVKERIEKAIAGLGDPDFAVRQRSSEALRGSGIDALASLRPSLDSPDEEVRLRAERIIDEIESSRDADDLELHSRPEQRDQVITLGVTIHGVVRQQEFCIRSPYGDLRIPRGDLLGIVFREHGPQEGKVSIPADAAVPGSWIDTKLDVGKGKRLSITASGQMSVPDWGEMCGPEGLQRLSDQLPGFNMLSLVGKIGAGGAPFLVGPEYRVLSAAAGRLYLGVVPFRYSPAAGSFEARIEVR